MSSIENWNETVRMYRQASLQNGNHWHGEHARWYDTWVKENNYAEIVYPLFRPFVQGRVLDIGAGTGLFTQYFIRDADHVDVVEPSEDMLTLLAGNLGNRKNLTFYKTTIENFRYDQKHYDFSFAAHAFFNIMHIDTLLQKLLDHSSILGVLIGSGKPLDIFQVFRDEKLVVENRPHPPSHLDLIPVLEACGISYDIRFISSETKYCYQSKHELLEKIAAQCRIKDETLAPYRQLLEPNIQKNEQGYFVQGKREHVCLLIHKRLATFIN